MGDIYKDAYSIARTCISEQFCIDREAHTKISLPRTLKVRIFANPEYWGFSGTLENNCLVSGYAYFSNGNYTFFDGFEENWQKEKKCGDNIIGTFNNEERPDIGYRSVWDETGVTHYHNNLPDRMRGGAEVFLIDREAIETIDKSSCETTNPTEVFKKSPDRYGFGNKVLFDDSIYKNITGAWRLNTCDNCYSTEIINSLRNVCCSGSGSSTVKQSIDIYDHFGEYYDPTQKRCLSAQYTKEQECQPDGTVATEYKGKLISLQRDTGVSPYIKATLQYYNTAASGLRNGQILLIVDSGNNYDKPYLIFDVNHSTYTTAYLLGTEGNTNFTYSGINDSWIALNTIDPQSCCGGAALGVNDKTKQLADQPPYHIDIGRIFNNSKNKLQSNKDKYLTGKPRIFRGYVEASGLNGSGVPKIIDDNVIYPRELPYYGPYYEVDKEDKALRFFNEDRTITYKNGTCYTKAQTLEIFPDCLTQYYKYRDCDGVDRYEQINVPRLAFVYRPCNYKDVCSFSGNVPLTAGASGHPKTLEDLKRGFGGQEIVMYINLGTAYGKEIKRDPCDCNKPIPGTQPPNIVKIPSPVTYPCFMKFDLKPSSYGCLDPIWYNYAKRYLGILDTGICHQQTFFNACYVKQPYTTYGFIRNLCGHPNKDRKTVLKSMALRKHTGGYRDILPYKDAYINEPFYVNFIVPPDVTGSGYPVGDCSDPIDTGNIAYTGGGVTFNYTSCLSGNKPYWGLTDSYGRLAYPYFRTKLSSINYPCSDGTFQYVDFDFKATFSGGFPTSSVPFLIEIDHSDYCTGCSTSQLELKDHTITIQSLPTKYYHGTAYVDDPYSKTTHKYGFNYCKYPGFVIEPEITSSGWINEQCSFIVGSGSGISSPYIGETCNCIGYGFSTPLKVNILAGTNMPKYWSTSGVNNSYVKFGNCGHNFNYAGSFFGINKTYINFDFEVYFAAKMTCSENDLVSRYYDQYYGLVTDEYYSNGLSQFYKCGGCSHSYPATESKPNLFLDFWFVNKRYENIFKSLRDNQLVQETIKSFLKSGASRGSLTCGTATINNVCGCADNASQLAISNNIAGCTAFSGQRILRWNTNIPGCHNSKIKIYGWTNFKQDGSVYSNNCASWQPHQGYNFAGDSTCHNSNPCMSGSNASLYEGFMSNTGTFNIAECVYNSSDELKIGGSGPCGAIESGTNCVSLSGQCCTPSEAVDPNTGLRRNVNEYVEDIWGFKATPNYQMVGNFHCYITSLELLGEFTYIQFSAFGSGSCQDGWYGYLKTDHYKACQGSDTRFGVNTFLRWSGENLPGIGNVGPLVFDDPIAVRYTDFGLSQPIAESICAYDSGPNKIVEIDSEFFIPRRLRNTQGKVVDVHLGPRDCKVNMFGSEVGSTCAKPIPFNLPNQIGTASSNKVEVIRKTCHPEIMTVHKVTCNSGIYALHVSREFYEHDRNLYTVQVYNPGQGQAPLAFRRKLYGTLNGGRDIISYTYEKTKYAKLCNTGTIPSGASGISVMPYYGLLPKMPQTDTVSPCHANICVTGHPTFYKSNCINYEVNSSYTGGNGKGATAYILSSGSATTGCLYFRISNPGSGYFVEYTPSGSSSTIKAGCAIGIVSGLCVTVGLYVSESGTFDTLTQDYNPTGIGNYKWFVYSGALNYNDCGGYGGNCSFPTGIYPVTIIPCDATLSYDCEPDTLSCDGSGYYPDFYNDGSGELLWNFYNLFYDLNYPDSRFLTDADPLDNVWFKQSMPDDGEPPFPFNIQHDAYSKDGILSNYQTKGSNQSSILSTGQHVKCLHSCIQDHISCGGSFFCNKEFFPRRSYLAGTHVTKLAPFSMCVQNGEKSWGNWLEGHVKDDFVDTYKLSPLEKEKQHGWLDPCKSGMYTELTYNVGIDDHIIYVNDITPLLGEKHIYFRTSNPNSLDGKFCFQLESGCYNALPVHNNETVNGIAAKIFDNTYYEIKNTGCLFEPFKIMVDVNCCPERLGHPGTSDPMYLSWVVKNVPSVACKGWIANPLGKPCEITDCQNKSINLKQYLNLVQVNYTKIVGYGTGTGCPGVGYHFFYFPTPCGGQTATTGCANVVLYKNKYYVIPVTTDEPWKCSDICDLHTHCTIWSRATYIGEGQPFYLADIPLIGSGVNKFGASGCGTLNCHNYHYCKQFYNLEEGGLPCNFVGSDIIEYKNSIWSPCPYPSLLKVTVTE